MRKTRRKGVGDRVAFDPAAEAHSAPFNRSSLGDPLDSGTIAELVRDLNQKRQRLPSDYLAWLLEICKGQEVLDIGIVDHSSSRMSRPDWKFGELCKVARSCVGIDINDSAIAELSRRGFDVKVCDATSETYIGKRFEFVHCGDVIEHVDSAVALLKFCGRHLEPGGRIFLRTPNCHHFNYRKRVRRLGTDVSNLEHVSYITPAHMVELARRSNLFLVRYYVQWPRRPFWRAMGRALHNLINFRFRHFVAEFVSKPETYSTIFVYELMAVQDSS